MVLWFGIFWKSKIFISAFFFSEKLHPYSVMCLAPQNLYWPILYPHLSEKFILYQESGAHEQPSHTSSEAVLEYPFYGKCSLHDSAQASDPVLIYCKIPDHSSSKFIQTLFEVHTNGLFHRSLWLLLTVFEVTVRHLDHSSASVWLFSDTWFILNPFHHECHWMSTQNFWASCLPMILSLLCFNYHTVYLNITRKNSCYIIFKNVLFFENLLLIHHWSSSCDSISSAFSELLC